MVQEEEESTKVEPLRLAGSSSSGLVGLVVLWSAMVYAGYAVCYGDVVSRCGECAMDGCRVTMRMVCDRIVAGMLLGYDTKCGIAVSVNVRTSPDQWRA